MITLDKIKIVSHISNIELLDENRFKKVIREGRIIERKYYEEKYLLDITINYEKDELVLEFTGKILEEGYPQLISLRTIGKCFENINSLGLCLIDVEGMMDSDVVKCDITKDIAVENVPALTKFIRNHNKNYLTILCRKMKNGNMTIEKNVTGKKYKKRMVVYDKGKEMRNADNKQFVQDNGLEGYFDGLCRFELNLNSKEQIRKSLGITNTKLKTVLGAETNPILDFIDEVVKAEIPTTIMTDKKAYITNLVLQDCDYDLERVQAKMREFYPSKGTNMKKVMEPYRLMMEKVEQTDGQEYWNAIREKLAE